MEVWIVAALGSDADKNESGRNAGCTKTERLGMTWAVPHARLEVSVPAIMVYRDSEICFRRDMVGPQLMKVRRAVGRARGGA